MVDLGDGQVALFPKVAEHVRLALQVRLPLPIYLGDERGTVSQLDLVDLPDAAAAHRAGALQTLAQCDLYSFGDHVLRHVGGYRRGGPRMPLRSARVHARNRLVRRSTGRGPRVRTRWSRSRGTGGPRRFPGRGPTPPCSSPRPSSGCSRTYGSLRG